MTSLLTIFSLSKHCPKSNNKKNTLLGYTLNEHTNQYTCTERTSIHIGRICQLYLYPTGFSLPFDENLIETDNSSNIIMNSSPFVQLFFIYEFHFLHFGQSKIIIVNFNWNQFVKGNIIQISKRNESLDHILTGEVI